MEFRGRKINSLSVRDLQRVLSANDRGGRHYGEVYVEIRHGDTLIVERTGAWYSTPLPCPAVWVKHAYGRRELNLAATLARLGALRGYDFRPFAPVPPPEERKKDTSAVDGSAQAGDASHGGDSASGEVPDARSGGGAPEEKPSSPAEAEGNGDGGRAPATQECTGARPETGREATSGLPAPAAQAPASVVPAAPAERRDGRSVAGGHTADPTPAPSGQGAGEDAEVAAGEAGADDAGDSHPDDGGSDEQAASDPTEAGCASAAPAGAPGLRKSPRGTLAGAAEASYASRRSHGGVFGRLMAAERLLVRDVRPVLARLVGDGADDDGPRMDWSRAMARYLSHRPFAVCRREEEGRPAVAVLPDVSGSCSSFCDQSLRVASAIGELGLPGADVYVVSHSNGYPEQATRNGRPVLARSVLGDELRAHPEVAVVALGDWDAEWLYRDMAARPEVSRLLWLDGYCCRTLGAPVADQRRFLRGAGEWSAASRRKVRYVIGCGSATQFREALRLAMEASV